MERRAQKLGTTNRLARGIVREREGTRRSGRIGGVDAETKRPKTRLAFLDGLRGLAALYVVLHHASLQVPSAELSGIPAVARFVLRHGHYAVPVFITLSGYSLMLGLLANPEGSLASYFGRRARRIIPPYYGALGFCWLLAALSPEMRRPMSTPWDRALPIYTPGVIVSHLALIQNLKLEWMYRVAPPFWTLATEWQIYGIFPGLVVVWKRWGIVNAVVLGFSIGSAWAWLSIPLGNPALRELCPWYVGLFALGMAAADPPEWAGISSRTILAIAPAMWFEVLSIRACGGGYLVATDVLTGVLTARLIFRCARASKQRVSTPGLPLLESRPAVWLGTFSYSLYLIHYPILALANLKLREAGVGANPRLVGLLLIGVPVCLGVSWVFARIVEPRRCGLPSGSPGNRGLSVFHDQCPMTDGQKAEFSRSLVIGHRHSAILPFGSVLEKRKGAGKIPLEPPPRPRTTATGAPSWRTG